MIDTSISNSLRLLRRECANHSFLVKFMIQIDVLLMNLWIEADT